MNFDDVKELIQIIDKSQLTQFDLVLDTVSVKMGKNVGIQQPAAKPCTTTVQMPVAVQNTNPVQSVQAMPTAVAEPVPAKVAAGNQVKSPIVGTFFVSAGPDKPPFACRGANVKKGDVLCIVEAMKIMNEIVSEFDGEVKEVLAENGQLVEYGQPLFVIA